MKKTIVLLLIAVSLLTVLPEIHVPRVAASVPTWSPPQQLDLISGQDDVPSTVLSSNGTMWIVWQHYLDTGYYETYSSKNGFSSPVQLPTSYTFTISPAVGQLANSSIIMVWSSNQTGHWNLYYRLYTKNSWGPVAGLTVSNLWNDFNPKITLASNSTLWVVWERHPLTNNSTLVYYKTLTGSSWSRDTRLSPSPPPNGIEDYSPYSAATNDGRIWVTWARLISSNTTNVYYSYYNGQTWSSQTALTTVRDLDMNPAIGQDRNGTMWLVWSRPVFLGYDSNCPCNVYNQKLFYKTSNDGLHWTADTQLTSYGTLANPLDDGEPSLVQGFDKSLYIFYSSDYPLGQDFKIFYLKSSTIGPVHNAAITGVVASSIAFQGQSATILITVTNLGDYSDTLYFNITATNSTTYTVATLSPRTLPLGSTTMFTFGWNTTGIPLKRYSLSITFSIPNQPLLFKGGDKATWGFITVLPFNPLPPCKIGHFCVL